MSNKHTPGPWRIKAAEGSPIEDTGLVMSCNPLYPVPVCDTGIAYWYNLRASAAHALKPGEIDDQILLRQANAKLIAAAPQLLETIKQEFEKVLDFHKDEYGELGLMGMIRKFAADDFYRHHYMAKAYLAATE